MTALALAPAAAPSSAPSSAEAVELSIPGLHCAACIRKVEGALLARPEVAAARVNLTQRRVRVSAAPGTSPTALIAALAAAGFEAHELTGEAASAGRADATGRALLARLAVAGFAMMNVMILSVAVWSGAAEATRELFHWISAAIALPAVAYAAQPFFASAHAALRARRVNMDVPIALAIGLATLMSLYETALGGGEVWFEAALSLSFFLLGGRYLEHRARMAARSAAAELAALESPRATVIEPGARRELPVADIRPGMSVALLPGARCPVDGRAEGPARIDRSALTGESDPVAVEAGDPVCSGEVVLDAPLTVTATARAEDSTLRRLAALVAVAEGARHRHAALADRVAALYAPAVHTLAAAAFAGWWLWSGDALHALRVAVAVLIITCPCALALAAPAVGAAVTGRLFRRGVLVKSATALERLAAVDTVLIDKTGTLTTGTVGLPPLDAEAAGVALALAEASAHPVSRALAQALRGVVPEPLTDLREVPGEGVRAFWRGAPVSLGRGPNGPRLVLPGRALDLSPGETLRPGAADLAARLKAMGLSVRMVTGDAPRRAAKVAEAAGIGVVHAGMRPEDKAALAEALACDRHKVLMIGDGLNDAAVLAAAHASISPATALDAARAASDVVLLGGGLETVPGLLIEARAADRRIRENFGISFAYNVVAIPVALLGLATPLIAAVAMSTSSLTVVLNALRRPRA